MNPRERSVDEEADVNCSTRNSVQLRPDPHMPDPHVPDPGARSFAAPALSNLVALHLTYRWCDAPASLPPRRRGQAQTLNSWFRERLLHALREQACLHLRAPRPTCVRCDSDVRERCPLPAIYPPLGSGDNQPAEALASLHTIDVLHRAAELRLKAGDLVRVDVVLIGPARRSAGALLSALRTLEDGRLRLERVDNLTVALQRFEAPNGRWPLPVAAHPVALADAPLHPVGDAATEAHLVDWLTATGCLELELLTPLRLTQGGRTELAAFDLAVFTARLLRRLHALHETSALVRSGEMITPLVDEGAVQAEIAALASAFTVEADTHVRQAERRGHGGHRHPLGGLRGVVRVTSAQPWALRRLASALVVGAWVGVGRCATMGLGRLRVRPAVALAPLATPVPGSRGAVLTAVSG